VTPAARTGAALLALSFTFAAPALADVVVHDGGVGRDKDAATRVEEATGQRPARVLADDVLAGPSRPLVAELTMEPCEGDSIEFDASERVDAVLSAVLGFDLEGADAGLTELRTLLACSAELVPARTLARLSFLEGALRFDQGVPEEASAAMSDAAVLDEEYTGERGFPAAHLELLSAARNELRAGKLFLWASPGTKTIYIDGQEIEAAGTEGAELGRGLHLVQLETADGLRGMFVRTRGAQSTLVMPGAGRDLWQQSGSGDGADAGMSLVVQDEFGGRSGDVHLLQYRGRSRRATTWPAGGGAPTVWAEGGAEAAATKKAPATVDPGTPRRFRLSVGGGWQFVAPFHYALIAVEAGVRIVGPLEIGAIARPSFGGVHEFPTPAGDPTISGPLFFVPFGGYVAVRKPGAISPWVGVAGHVAWNQDRLVSPEWLGGVTGIGGIDLAPADGAFFVRIHGEAGFLWESFTGRLAVGVGLRL
jgi:hypothetical protein